MTKIVVLALILIVVLNCSVFAQDDPMQRPVQSWMGLTGLYIVPTARVIGCNTAAFTFSEAKHVEYVPGTSVSQRYMDRQISQAVTFGVSDNIEMYYRRDRNLYDQGNKARIDNTTFYDYGFKWQIAPENNDKGTPAVAFAVRDLGDNRDLGDIPNVRNGCIGFLLATKRVATNPDSGRFTDFTVGIGRNYKYNSMLFGMECAVSPTVSIIAEGMSNSPFVNFRDYTAAGNVGGRFVYNTGFRAYPDSVPGMVIDLGVVGDGAFEFSFAWGYIRHL
jgi:hypothetical protein